MDLVPAYDAVVGLASRNRDASSIWQALVALVAAEAGPQYAAPLDEVDVPGDIAFVRSQLTELFQSEPPGAGIDAMYFGLFDTADDHGNEGTGYYIAGVRGFDPTDGDSLCSPEWWPDGRYLQSHALDAVKSSELAARAAGQQAAASFLGYAGQLGAALIVSRFALSGLDAGRRVVVGFDSGDYVELGV